MARSGYLTDADSRKIDSRYITFDRGGNMKKLCILLVAALLLCLCVSAWAEEGMRVEVIKMDGVSVVVLTPETTIFAQEA